MALTLFSLPEHHLHSLIGQTCSRNPHIRRPDTLFLELDIVIVNNVCQHYLQLRRSEEPSRAGIFSEPPRKERCRRRDELMLHIVRAPPPCPRGPIRIEIVWIRPDGSIVVNGMHRNGDGGARGDDDAIGECKVFEGEASHVH